MIKKKNLFTLIVFSLLVLIFLACAKEKDSITIPQKKYARDEINKEEFEKKERFDYLKSGK